MTSDLQTQPEDGTQSTLDQRVFFGDMVGALAGTLENVIGLEESAGFVARVGGQIGAVISERYNPDAARLEPEQIAQILVDLKARIGGTFKVESVSDEQIVLVNSACPFAERVEGRPSLCMMTTSVFGSVAARGTGYAKVHVDEAIATGHGRCRVIVSLTVDDAAPGYEFFAG